MFCSAVHIIRRWFLLPLPPRGLTALKNSTICWKYLISYLLFYLFVCFNLPVHNNEKTNVSLTQANCNQPQCWRHIPMQYFCSLWEGFLLHFCYQEFLPCSACCCSPAMHKHCASETIASQCRGSMWWGSCKFRPIALKVTQHSSIYLQQILQGYINVAH